MLLLPEIPAGCSIVDSHAHVVKEYFGEEHAEVIERTFKSGVVQMINPGVVTENIDELLDIADKHANIYTAIGLHPHEAEKWSPAVAEQVKTAARHPKVVAIGECGLDFFYNHSVRDAQLSALEAQIKIALELNKPVIIHCRDAWEDVLHLLESAGEGRLRGVFHCFTGGPEVLPAIEKLDFYVSFSGILTFAKSQPIQEAAKLVRSDRMLVETDCPYLAPQKVRGKRNEPAYVWWTAQKLADLRGEALSTIADNCSVNTRRLFDLPQPA